MRSDDGELVWFKSKQFSLFAPTSSLLYKGFYLGNCNNCLFLTLWKKLNSDDIEHRGSGSWQSEEKKYAYLIIDKRLKNRCVLWQQLKRSRY